MLALALLWKALKLEFEDVVLVNFIIFS
jgi:hypothetical protein